MLIFIVVSLFISLHLLVVYKHKITNLKSKIENPKKVKSFKDIAVLIPCYNEEVVLYPSIKSFSTIEYPNLKVVFINDGSRDKTIDILRRELDLVRIENKTGKLESETILGTYRSKKYENMFVIDKENGGKADSLNAGINFVDSDYIVTLDADSILKDDALYYINCSLQDEDVIAVGGNVVVSQGIKNYNGDVIKCKASGKFLETIQFIEYLRGFFVLKNSYAKMNALFVISGAFGIFKRDVMLDVNGFTKTVGEDIDVTIKFNRYALENKKKIKYNDQAICFTEVPNNWHDLYKQRVRWQKAFLDAFKNHFKFLFKNFFKSKLAFFMLFEATLVMYTSTLLTLFGLYIVAYDTFLGRPIDYRVYLIFAIGLLIFIIYNVLTFILTERSKIALRGINIPRFLLVLLYEFMIYRPIIIAIIIYGSIEYFFKPGGWNKVSRIGVSESRV